MDSQLGDSAIVTKNTKNYSLNDVGNNNLSLDGLRALVVDDDADNSDLIAFILQSAGVQVMTAASVIEALEIIGQFEPNLLISDIAMPEINGYSFIRKIRTFEPPLGIIPAIAITALATKDECDFALACGFNVCLTKPIELDNLIPEIITLLKIR